MVKGGMLRITVYAQEKEEKYFKLNRVLESNVSA